MKRHLSLVDIVLAIAAGGVLMLAVWQDFDPKVFLLTALFIGASELFIQLRWRLSIACPRCGFDPVTYKTDPQKACRRVQDFMERRRQHPDFLLMSRPRLPVLRKPKSQASQASAAVENLPKNRADSKSSSPLRT